eukprot:UN01360
MKNYIYIVGDSSSKEVFLIGSCLGTQKVRLNIVQKKGWKVKGCVLTHYHVDHAGGKPPPPFDSFGVMIAGAKEISEKIYLFIVIKMIFRNY